MILARVALRAEAVRKGALDASISLPTPYYYMKGVLEGCQTTFAGVEETQLDHSFCDSGARNSARKALAVDIAVFLRSSV